MTLSRSPRDWAWWLAPIAFLLALYWNGLRCWFIADDFAWLGLIRQVHSAGNLLNVLFEPAAQGTIRPWSERGFFLLFESIFGLDPLPFRITVFLTMAANLTLVAWITRRITNSRAAGLIAAICWSANAGLATVMSWTSAYNEAMCPLFLLAALALFIRFTETGERRFWWWQLVVFSLGFGALELNVVYPAIAAGYVLFAAPPLNRRRWLLSIVPLVAISIVYFGIHRLVAPLPATGAYVLKFNRQMLTTFRLYGDWSLLPMSWENFGHSALRGTLLLSVELLGIATLFAAEIRRRRRTVLFFVTWFLATLAPVLPLPGHRDDYYLTIPLIGLGMMAGWAATCASRMRVLPLIPILAYLAAEIPVAHSANLWWLNKTLAVRGLVLGVEAAHEAHPDKTIVLEGVTSQLFNDAVGHSAFFPLSIDNVYLTPGSELNIHPDADMANLDDLVLDPAIVQHALSGDKLVLYSVAGDHLRNITERYGRAAPAALIDRLPNRVDVGNPLYSWLLGREWLPAESSFRWMPGQASVHLRGPQKKGGTLRLEGYCPEEQLKRSPRHLMVTADGDLVGDTQINDPESSFVRLFVLPDSLVGRNSVEIGIQVTPVERKGGQEFGLTFGNIAILP